MSIQVDTGGVSKAGSAVRGRGETFQGARGAVSDACASAAGAGGHEDVEAGIAEFAACWAAALGLLGDAAGTLAESLGGAAKAYGTVEKGNTAAMRAS